MEIKHSPQQGFLQQAIVLFAPSTTGMVSLGLGLSRIQCGLKIREIWALSVGFEA